MSIDKKFVTVTNIKTVYYQTVEIGRDMYELATHKFADFTPRIQHTCRLMNSGDGPKTCSNKLTKHVVDVAYSWGGNPENPREIPGQMDLF